MRVYCTWEEFGRLAELPRCDWARILDIDYRVLERVRDAETRGEPVELIPTMQMPTYRVEG